MLTKCVQKYLWPVTSNWLIWVKMQIYSRLCYLRVKSKVSKFKLVAKLKLASGKWVRSDFDARSVDGLGHYLKRKTSPEVWIYFYIRFITWREQACNPSSYANLKLYRPTEWPSALCVRLNRKWEIGIFPPQPPFSRSNTHAFPSVFNLKYTGCAGSKK